LRWASSCDSASFLRKRAKFSRWTNSSIACSP
jgi:hypothetical protein